MKDLHPGTISIISDGTGETAATMIRAALVQYMDLEVHILRHKNVRTEGQLEPIIQEAVERKALIAYTVVAVGLRNRIRALASEKGIPTIDLLGPILTTLDQYLGVSEGRNPQAGLLRVVDDTYYRRIEAIEYTVKHDDGKALSELGKADIILVGISRTSKTPLSIFLSHKGFRVANIPLVLNTPLPAELNLVDQRKIVGLVIDIESLQRIRKNRLEKFGQDPGGTYASLDHIMKEIEFAHEVFRQNKRWPVFNVTDRALEETATEITRIVGTRMGWPDSAFF
ncbi:MAG: bifunctional ([pyruvate, phosphate dikinase] phosphate) phosphotransferase/[pyruvate, phosphate dikinase] kinase [Bdellovibrio sp.]|nr:MAG: bifunctional ([pyruvate, phosphate dikinase] phosphate) phosphotransferase/[pyruvate, phosphate dikinase] kinase [Bdellovibrio sp.]